MRNKFDRQLQILDEQLIHMGELCESAIANATKAVINADAEIDEMEKDIEKLCLKLLLQQQPVAKDLRRISAALKMITDMERIGDQTADIAEIVISANTEESVDIKDIGRMASVVSWCATASHRMYRKIWSLRARSCWKMIKWIASLTISGKRW